ncbi:MAG: BclA C-terminal domain-containing protein [Candidatus Dependentiae bacterium]
MIYQLFVIMLIAISYCARADLTFYSDKPETQYVILTDEIKHIIKKQADANDQSIALKALSQSIEEEKNVVPSQLFSAAVHDMNSCSEADLVAVAHYQEQIAHNNADIVLSATEVKKQCKRFNKVCVKKDVLICGNLTVCCNAPNIVCDPGVGPRGATGPTGATGDPGITGFTGNQGAAGARGLQGATGNTGPQGITGDPGFTGFTGAQGNKGNTGNTGANGITGLTGFTGPQGATGIGEADQALAYIYSSGATSISGGSGFTGSTAIPFDTNAVLVGILHNPGSTDIVIQRTGTYEITYNVNSAQINQLALYQNSTFIAGSRYFSGSVSKQNNGSVIIQLNAGDVITLRNETTPEIATPTIITLNPQAGPNPAVTNISAAILIRQFA